MASTSTSTSNSSAPVCVVVGVGPGIGRSLALRFARGGYKVALCARSLTHSESIRSQLESEGLDSMSFVLDASSSESVSSAFTSIRRVLSPNISVLLYNAAVRRIRGIPVHELPESEFEGFWKINCYGAFLCAKQVLIGDEKEGDIGMRKRGNGTILFTGATGSLRALAGLSNFAVGKFGLRALAQALARENHPQGIHVAHVIIDGPVEGPIIGNYYKQKYLQEQQAKKSKSKAKGSAEEDESKDNSKEIEIPEGTLLKCDEVAEVYWQIHRQPKSVWTQELDIRPMREPIYSKL